MQAIFHAQVLRDIIIPTQFLLSQSSRQCFTKFDCWLDYEQETKPSEN